MTVVATIVQAATSPGSSARLRRYSPTDSSLSAASLSRAYSARMSEYSALSSSSSLLSGRRLVSSLKANVMRSRGCSASFHDHPLRQHARGFEILRIVQQHQRLQRRIRALAVDGAEEPLGRVEADRRMAAATTASRRCRGCGDRDPPHAPARTWSRSGWRALPRARAAGTDRRLARRQCGPGGRWPQARCRESARPPVDTTVRVRATRSPDPAPAASRRAANPADTWPTTQSASATPSGSTPNRRTSSPASRAAAGERAACPDCRNPPASATSPRPKNIAQ